MNSLRSNAVSLLPCADNLKQAKGPAQTQDSWEGATQGVNAGRSARGRAWSGHCRGCQGCCEEEEMMSEVVYELCHSLSEISTHLMKT